MLCIETKQENVLRIGTNSLQVSLSSIVAQKQKKKKKKGTLAHWNTDRQRYKTVQTKKIHNSKISSNLDLCNCLVFVVLFPSMNVCFGDNKHIKTTENWLDLECILRTR